jgi:PKD domain
MSCDGRPKLHLPALAVITLGLLLPGCGGSQDTINAKGAPVLGGAENQSTSSRATARSGGLVITLTAKPIQAKIGSPVELNATAYERHTPGALGYELRYGDGTSVAQDMVPQFCLMGKNTPVRRIWRLSHRYRKPGRYTVSLTVHVNCTSAHATATVAVSVT